MVISYLSSHIDFAWWSRYGVEILLTVFVVAQWAAFQALLVHYYFFRKKLKTPKPDSLRLDTIEKTLAFQADQLASIFGKLAGLRKEIAVLGVREERATAAQQHTSYEAGMVSMGEMNLKKRIQEIKVSELTSH